MSTDDTQTAVVRYCSGQFWTAGDVHSFEYAYPYQHLSSLVECSARRIPASRIGWRILNNSVMGVEITDMVWLSRRNGQARGEKRAGPNPVVPTISTAVSGSDDSPLESNRGAER